MAGDEIILNRALRLATYDKGQYYAGRRCLVGTDLNNSIGLII